MTVFRWSDRYETAVTFIADRDNFIERAVNALIDIRNRTETYFHDTKKGDCRYYRSFDLHQRVSETWVEAGEILSKRERERTLASWKFPNRLVCTQMDRDQSEKDDLQMVMELSHDIWDMVEANDAFVNSLEAMVKNLKPHLGGLRDIPLPPNVDRPEMWDTAAIVRAVKDGFTFLVPFVLGESLFSPNAYWIKGIQASANGLTVGPDHTPEIELIDNDWIRAMTYFRKEMVPKESWAAPPNRYGVVPVYVEIDPDTIDWNLLNRGYQIRSKG